MDAPAYYFRWSADGRKIYFVGSERGSNDLWSLTLEDRRERRLTQFAGKAGSLGSTALALDSEHIYFTWRNDLGTSG